MDESKRPVDPVAAEAATPQYSEVRGGLKNVRLAYKHIRSATGSGEVRQRLFDHVTVGMVGVALLALVGAVAIPVSVVVKGVALCVAVAVVCYYVFHRIGIFLSVSPRQALIFWQVLLGGFWLGIVVGLLVMMASLFFTD